MRLTIKEVDTVSSVLTRIRPIPTLYTVEQMEAVQYPKNTSTLTGDGVITIHGL